MITITKTNKLRHIVITKDTGVFYVELQPQQELVTGEGTYEVLASKEEVINKYGNIITELS